MKDLKVALVPVARIHFDVELADQLAHSFRTHLIFNGLKPLRYIRPSTSKFSPSTEESWLMMRS